MKIVSASLNSEPPLALNNNYAKPKQEIIVPRKNVMNVCGKPVRFLGKMASGHFTRCTRISGHSGACEDGDAAEDKNDRSAIEAKTLIAPNAKWPFKGKPPEGIGKPGTDLPHGPTPEEIPDGVVIQ